MNIFEYAMQIEKGGEQFYREFSGTQFYTICLNLLTGVSIHRLATQALWVCR